MKKRILEIGRILNKTEQQSINGGAIAPWGCVAGCRGGGYVYCDGTECRAVYGEGCYAKLNGIEVMESCPQ
ncbi:hypothetical protein [Aquimarina sp. 2201CG5-10]|uniref:hypothetical protein n=1 Tax=Aquimarina callyspongiae TaxID=3098150 RepID=UPI002AB39E11|nr:hypothetical protein [Aquimarina sp. 2201CG5-10]MDY8135572.1 hypothetical protein [Aquimarina sp. 2201CG5-10]